MGVVKEGCPFEVPPNGFNNGSSEVYPSGVFFCSSVGIINIVSL